MVRLRLAPHDITARAILHSFADVIIIINAHTMSFGHKNPEYTIDGQLGDRKGIMGEKGVTMSAIEQLNPGAPTY